MVIEVVGLLIKLKGRSRMCKMNDVRRVQSRWEELGCYVNGTLLLCPVDMTVSIKCDQQMPWCAVLSYVAVNCEPRYRRRTQRLH
jgi:hypothetical protein